MVGNSLRILVFIAMICGVGAFTGCQMAKGPLQPLGWNFSEQSKEIEKLAPLGTPRAEVERRLQAAGIVVSAGRTQALAYCDQWNRPGSSTPMNVALQFDAEGKLIGMRPAQAETSVIREESLAQGITLMDRSNSELSPQGNDETEAKDRRRTPFQDAPVRSR